MKFVSAFLLQRAEGKKPNTHVTASVMQALVDRSTYIKLRGFKVEH